MSAEEVPDDRFDEAEANVDHGAPWMFREDDAPNPLTIEVTDWSHAEWMNGVDRDGKKWSILVGSVVLTKRLIDGLVEEWDDSRGAFVVVETLGRVQPGEVVSIKYLGDREGVKYDYPDFRVSRKPPTQPASSPATGGDPGPAAETPPPLGDADFPAGPDDDIPY